MISEALEAYREIAKLFFDKWTAEASNIVGYTPRVIWQGEQGEIPNSSEVWLKFSTVNYIESQSTLYVCDLNKAKRYTCSGMVIIEVYLPRQIEQSFLKGRQLAHIAKLAFRGKKTPSGVWFRNVTITEVSSEELYFRINVTADYEYDEVG